MTQPRRYPPPPERDDRLDLFIKRYGLTQSKGAPLACRLFGCRVRDCELEGRHRLANDHTSLWNREGQPVVWVTQPYGADLRAVESWAKFAREHGLELWIDAHGSWHFPGQTILVTIGMDDWRRGL